MGTDLSVRQSRGSSLQTGLALSCRGWPLFFFFTTCLDSLCEKSSFRRRTMTANNVTSVHTLETSATTDLPHSYRDYQSRHCESELQRTEFLYSHMDSLQGTNRIEKLHGCRSLSWFARNTETGLVRVISNACRLRWCPICSKARSSFLSVQVKDWLKSFKNPKFLTLTMKHSKAPLEHQIKWLYENFRRYRQKKHISRKIRGGIWFFQLKKSKTDDLWHPHLHCVIDSPYIPHKLLSDLWKQQTKSSSVVDIRAIRKPEKIAEYVARYCARPCNLSSYSDDEIIEIFTVFHGRRLCGAWGSAKCVSFRPSKSADSDKWHRLGSWSDVIQQQNEKPRAKAILMAYLLKKPIPSGIYIRSKPTYEEQLINEPYPHVGLEDLHGNFEEFL